MEKSGKKIFSEKKMKKAYITWDDNDMESSEDFKIYLREAMTTLLEGEIFMIENRVFMNGPI